MYLSIVIPAYNEEKRLPGTLHAIQHFLAHKDYKAEIIVVVEKSEDNTLQLVKKFQSIYSNIRCLENDDRYGKGYSVRRGVLAAKGDLILFTDSDLSTPIQELDKLLPRLNECDCCCGQRIQIIKQPLYRQIMGIGFRYINYLFTGLELRDTQCGFKLFTNKFGRLVFQQMQVNGFAFDVEMLMISRKMGFKYIPVEVAWYNDDDSKVSPLRDSIRMLWDLIRINRSVQGKFKEIEVKVSG